MTTYQSRRKFLRYALQGLTGKALNTDVIERFFSIKPTKEGVVVSHKSQNYSESFDTIDYDEANAYFYATKEGKIVVFNLSNGGIIDAIAVPDDGFLVSKTADIYMVKNGEISNQPLIEKVHVNPNGYIVTAQNYEKKYILTKSPKGVMNLVDENGMAVIQNISNDPSAEAEVCVTRDYQQKLFFIVKDKNGSVIFTPQEVIYRTKSPDEEIIFRNYNSLYGEEQAIFNPDLDYLIAIYNKTQDVTHTELHLTRNSSIAYFTTTHKLKDVVYTEEDNNITIFTDISSLGHMFNLADERVTFIKPQELVQREINPMGKVEVRSLNPQKSAQISSTNNAGGMGS